MTPQTIPAPEYGPVVPPEIAAELGMTPQTIPAPEYERGIFPAEDGLPGLHAWQEEIRPEMRIEGDLEELTDAMRDLARALRHDRAGDRAGDGDGVARRSAPPSERRIEQHNTYYVDGGAEPVEAILARIEESAVRQIEELA